MQPSTNRCLRLDVSTALATALCFAIALPIRGMAEPHCEGLRVVPLLAGGSQLRKLLKQQHEVPRPEHLPTFDPDGDVPLQSEGVAAFDPESARMLRFFARSHRHARRAADDQTADDRSDDEYSHLDIATAFLATSPLTELSVEDLTRLSSKHLRALYFPRVTVISPEVAREIASFDGAVCLDGLRDLPVAVARELAAHHGFLSLNGLTLCSADAAKELGRHRGSLSLSGLSRLDADVATHLAGVNGTLVLDGITEVAHGKTESKAMAAARELLARSSGGNGDQGRGAAPRDEPSTSPPCLSAEAAVALSRHEGGLVLGGLAGLPRQTVEALAAHRGPLTLATIEEIELGLLDGLANFRGLLVLPAIDTLTPEQAACLGKLSCDLELPNLQRLTQAAAARLAPHQGELRLPKIRDLDARTAQALDGHGDRLKLGPPPGVVNFADMRLWKGLRRDDRNQERDPLSFVFTVVFVVVMWLLMTAVRRRLNLWLSSG